jgi:hypothetical protein
MTELSLVERGVVGFFALAFMCAIFLPIGMLYRKLWRLHERELNRYTPGFKQRPTTKLTRPRLILCLAIFAAGWAWYTFKPLLGATVADPFTEGYKAHQRGDYAEAIRLYREGAEQGDAAAQLAFGASYLSGEGVPQDYVEAYKWVDLAISRFPDSERENRDRAIALRDRLARERMTPDQMAEAQKLARDWKPRPER